MEDPSRHAESKKISSHPSPLEMEKQAAAGNDGAKVFADDAQSDDKQTHLGWRSWVVVLVASFAFGAQIFVVVAAAGVIAFIIRDLGQPAIAGWIIQGPLLMQSVLAPIAGRLSDVLDRKYLVSIPPLFGVAGAVMSAEADSMSVLIGGGILIGVTLATTSIVAAIPSEVLPLKYRALASGALYLGGVGGGVVGVLGAGALIKDNPGGWRGIFWIQAAFHLTTFLGFVLLYWPKRSSDYPKATFKSVVWACDPIGSALFVSSVTLMLLALDWTGGTYPWSDPHVAVPLSLGLGLLVLFCLYEWKGRSDGILAHVFFRNGRNFALANFAIAVEGWIFFSAVNSVIPQAVLNLGFDTNAWRIAVRSLGSLIPAFITSIFITLYATRTKDLKSPLLLTFGIFLVGIICFSTLTPSQNTVELIYNGILGIGQAGPLVLIIVIIQFNSPHSFLSTASGLAYSFRAIGGAFGSAVLNSIISGKLKLYGSKVSMAAIEAGLPASSTSALLLAFATGSPALFAAVPGLNPTILSAATAESRKVYARAYRVAFASIIPFVVLAIIAVAMLRPVKKLMTEKIEATVEHVPAADEEKH